MSYESLYSDLVQRHLGRKPVPSDGSSDAELDEAEGRLGSRLPAAVRRYYRVAGNLVELNHAHNLLFAPSDLHMCEGFLIFMEENQAVVHWGIRAGELTEDDPDVWQRVNVVPPEWYSEEMTFSEFIVRTLDWQAGLEGADPV
ncbi:MAG: hypothetical protein M3416_06505 [Acidobacteriota bacterium]|nr:hypothetical protein [Acidobacteriota bacterium]